MTAGALGRFASVDHRGRSAVRGNGPQAAVLVEYQRLPIPRPVGSFHPLARSPHYDCATKIIFDTDGLERAVQHPLWRGCSRRQRLEFNMCKRCGFLNILVMRTHANARVKGSIEMQPYGCAYLVQRFARSAQE